VSDDRLTIHTSTFQHGGDTYVIRVTEQPLKSGGGQAMTDKDRIAELEAALYNVRSMVHEWAFEMRAHAGGEVARRAITDRIDAVLNKGEKA